MDRAGAWTAGVENALASAEQEDEQMELATRLGYLDRYDEAAALCERLRHNSPGIESDAAGALLRHFENIQVSHQNRGRLRDRVTYE